MTSHVAPARGGHVDRHRCRPARHPSTGVSVYVVELARALGELAPDRFVRIGVRRDGPLDTAEDPGRRYLRGRYHSVWLQAHADRDARAAGCGLVHYTNATAPLRATRAVRR